MAARTRTETRKRTVTAPRPERGPAPNAVISVELNRDEEVLWIWTHVDGESVVTGYEVVEKTDGGEELEA